MAFATLGLSGALGHEQPIGEALAADSCEYLVASVGVAGISAQSRGCAQGADPLAIQRWKTATCSGGHAPSQGIVPLLRRSRIASWCAWTSLWDQRSKALSIESRS